MWVPVVHLTSNRKGSDLYNKRHLQLQVIFAKICPAAEPGKHFPPPLSRIRTWGATTETTFIW